MFESNNLEKKFFLENGYIIKKNILSQNLNFRKISKKFKDELEELFKSENIKNLGGYKSGNLNIYPGKFASDILSILNEKSFKNYFNFLTNDDIDNYKIILGGNLNLPNSKYQFFHTDGKWSPRMIVLNIATSDIHSNNGPLELIEKSHLNKINYHKFLLKNFLEKKKKVELNFGEILIREHRLWHRGTTNNSKKIREMLGIIFIKNENFNQKESLEKVESTKMYLHSNIFGTSKKEKIKEFIFINFKFVLFIYKLIISIIKKN